MSTESAPNPHPGMGFKQFVALIACMMALTALAIDAMLPGLQQIGSGLGVTNPNHNQLIVTAFLIGMGGAQLIYGPLADRYGRKPVIAFGLILYGAAAAVAAFAPSFEVLLIARFVQGLGAASTRVVPIAIVRDCYAGRQMARITSMAFIVFLGIPIIAPSFGAAILAVASWRWLFGVFFAMAALVLAWLGWRLPETLKPENRIPISPGRIAKSFGIALKDRRGLGYSLAQAALMSALFGFINSAQQVFTDVFDAEAAFPLIFAACAGSMAVASFVNVKLVGRLGTRMLSHVSLLGFIAFAAADMILAWTGHQSLVAFSLLQASLMFCFGLIAGNFGAMAMENLGHVAGAASSVQGFISMVVGAGAGFYIGQHFDGTVGPLTTAYFISGVACLLVVLWAEKGRLFKGRNKRAPSDASRGMGH